MTNRCCDREIIYEIPKGWGTAKCGGLDCNHCTVYLDPNTSVQYKYVDTQKDPILRGP